jgi:hypothetical protein
MRLQQREARRQEQQQQQQQQVTTILGMNPSFTQKGKTKSSRRSNNLWTVLQSALLLCIALVVLLPAVIHPQFIILPSPQQQQQQQQQPDLYHSLPDSLQSSWSKNRSDYSVVLDVVGNVPPPPKQQQQQQFRTGTTRLQQDGLQQQQHHQSSSRDDTTTTTTTNSKRTSTLLLASASQVPRQQQQEQQQQPHHTYCHYHDYHNFNYRYPMYTLDNPNDGGKPSLSSSSSAVPATPLPLPFPLPTAANGTRPRRRLQVGLVTTKARQMRLTSKHVLYDGIQGSNYLTLVTICDLSTGFNCGATNHHSRVEEEDDEEDDESSESSPTKDGTDNHKNSIHNNNNDHSYLPSSRNDIDLWIIDVVTIRKLGEQLLHNEIILDLIRQASSSSSSSLLRPSWTSTLPQQRVQHDEQLLQSPRPTPGVLFLDYSDQVNLQPPSIDSNPPQSQHDGPSFYRKLGIHFYYNASMTTTTTTTTTSTGRDPPVSLLEDEEVDVDQEEEDEEKEGDKNDPEDNEMDTNTTTLLRGSILDNHHTTLPIPIPKPPPIPPQPFIRIALSSVVQGRWYHRKTKTIHLGQLYNPNQIRIGGGPPLHAPYAVRLDIVTAMYKILPTVVATTTTTNTTTTAATTNNKERLRLVQEQQQEEHQQEEHQQDDTGTKEDSLKRLNQGELQEASEESPHGENIEEWNDSQNRRHTTTTKKKRKKEPKVKQQEQQQRNPHHHHSKHLQQLSPALDAVRNLDVIHLWDLSGSRDFNRHAGNYRDEVSRVIYAMNGTLLWPSSSVPTTTTLTTALPPPPPRRPRIISTSTEFRGKSGTLGRNKANRDYVTALLTTKIVVVVMRDMWEDHYRLLEAISCGALVLTDHMLALQNMGFVPGQSIVMFDNTTQLQDLIHYYLQHDTERITIAHEGWKIALGRHLPWHRLEEVLFGCPLTKVNQPYLI